MERSQGETLRDFVKINTETEAPFLVDIPNKPRTVFTDTTEVRFDPTLRWIPVY